MSHDRIALALLPTILLASSIWADDLERARQQSEFAPPETVELEDQEGSPRRRRERTPHDRPDLRDAEVLEIKQRLLRLRAEEKQLKGRDGNEERLADLRIEATGLERELLELVSQQGGRRDSNLPNHAARDVHRRLEHMRMAIEHLQRAGLDDEARHVAKRAEALERSMHDDHRLGGQPFVKFAESIDDLRREVRQLRDQVQLLMEQFNTGEARLNGRRDRDEVENERSPRRLRGRPARDSKESPDERELRNGGN